MERTELLEEKQRIENEIINLEQLLENLYREYAKEHSKYIINDILISTTFKNEGVRLRYNGDCTYSASNDLIYYDCEVVSTDNPNIKIGTFFSIPDIYLKKV